MSETRNSRAERRLIGRAADILRIWGHSFPANPCDTKMLFAFAKIGNEVRSAVTLALDEITAGPHADFDYLDSATEHLNKADSVLQRFKT